MNCNFRYWLYAAAYLATVSVFYTTEHSVAMFTAVGAFVCLTVGLIEVGMEDK